MENENLKITAPSAVWKRCIKALSLSCESSRDDGDSTSFLSCILFSTSNNEGSVQICSESLFSTTSINFGADLEGVSFSGCGDFLLKSKDFSSHISQMPQETDVSVKFYDTYAIISTEPGEDVLFRSPIIEIEGDDSVPKASYDFPEGSVMVETWGNDISNRYKIGSVMAKSMEKDATAGQNPLSGCVCEIKDDGIQFFSLCTSGSEAYLEGTRIDVTKEDARSLTAPGVTLPRLNIFSEESTPIVFGISKDKKIHIQGEFIHMSITPLGIGGRSDSVSFGMILNVLNPLWKNKLVKVKVQAKEFFTALSRSASVNPDSVKMVISDTYLRIYADVGKENEFPFKQKITCSTEWDTDDEHSTEMNVLLETVKKISTMFGGSDFVVFNASVKEDGTPWAITVYDEKNYSVDNPHNFFMMPCIGR